MAHLQAENITLTFPLHARVQGARLRGASTGKGNLVYGPKGDIKGVRALEDISLDLRNGDRLALVGRNGAGKTTLLQILAGILPPDSGKVTRSGRIRSLININLGLQKEASGHRNITLCGLATGYSRKQIEEKREEIADFSELESFLDMPVSTYSSGMRMRLNFAIATAFEPEILLLDEWVSTGDAEFRAKATRRMQDFVGQAGILVFASHSFKLLEENCNKGIWLQQGRIKAQGPVNEILAKYEKASNRTRAAARRKK